MSPSSDPSLLVRDGCLTSIERFVQINVSQRGRPHMTNTDELEMYRLLWESDLLLALPLPTLRSVLTRFAGERAKDVLLYEIKLLVGSYGDEPDPFLKRRYHDENFDFARFDNFREDMLLLAELPGGYQTAVVYVFEIFGAFIDCHHFGVSKCEYWFPKIDGLFDSMLKQRMLTRSLESSLPHLLMFEIKEWRASAEKAPPLSKTLCSPVPFERSCNTLYEFFEGHARATARLLAVKTLGAILPPELGEMIEEEYILNRMRKLRGY